MSTACSALCARWVLPSFILAIRASRSPVPWPCRLDRLPAKSPPKPLPFPCLPHVPLCVPDGCCHPSSWRSAHLVHADSPSPYCSLCSSCSYRCVLDLPASVSRSLILSLTPLEILRSSPRCPAVRSNALLRWPPTWLRLSPPSSPSSARALST